MRFYKKLSQKNKMYVTWKTTSVTHINYEIIKQRFKGHDKNVKKTLKNQNKGISTKHL